MTTPIIPGSGLSTFTGVCDADSVALPEKLNAAGKPFQQIQIQAGGIQFRGRYVKELGLHKKGEPITLLYSVNGKFNNIKEYSKAAQASGANPVTNSQTTPVVVSAPAVETYVKKEARDFNPNLKDVSIELSGIMQAMLQAGGYRHPEYREFDFALFEEELNKLMTMKRELEKKWIRK